MRELSKELKDEFRSLTNLLTYSTHLHASHGEHTNRTPIKHSDISMPVISAVASTPAIHGDSCSVHLHIPQCSHDTVPRHSSQNRDIGICGLMCCPMHMVVPLPHFIQHQPIVASSAAPPAADHPTMLESEKEEHSQSRVMLHSVIQASWALHE